MLLIQINIELEKKEIIGQYFKVLPNKWHKLAQLIDIFSSTVNWGRNL